MELTTSAVYSVLNRRSREVSSPNAYYSRRERVGQGKTKRQREMLGRYLLTGNDVGLQCSSDNCVSLLSVCGRRLVGRWFT